MTLPTSRLGAVAAAALFLQMTPAPTKPTDSIERVGTLRVTRAAYTATTLRSGQVLVVGGMTGAGDGLSAVELFDPATHASRTLDPLAERRIDHSATLLGDGRVLVAGGYNGDYLRSVELFDPATRRFRSAGSLVVGRSGHTATPLPDGRILIVGGVGQGWTFLRSAELYDPATGRSELVGSMSVPRESHTATLLADGRVLVIGGHNGRRQDMEVHASAEIFSPATRRFEPVGALTTARHKHDAVRLLDGRVIVIAGADRSDRRYFNTTEVFDPRTGAFTPGPSMSNARYKIAGTSVLLSNGDVLVTSGARQAELLDVGRSEFRLVSGTFPAAYRFAAAARLPGGDVFIAGGYADNNETTGGVWQFHRDPSGAR